MVRDTRLVQTAVIGNENSDVPVFLPPEAIELDAFRASHSTDTFWCGLLLGGCGGRLDSKLYHDRQCHFQHHRLPGGEATNCRRPAVGETSADHLYVKGALSRSLLDHGRTAHFTYPPPIGSLLDVDLRDGPSLRIHMDASTAPDWEQQRTVVLGPGVVPDRDHLAGCPYVYRVRCETDGTLRRVWIGTQSMAHPTEWVPLSDCTWTDSGLLTPAASRILREPPATRGHPVGPAPTLTVRGLPSPSVATFIRGLEKARRNGTVEHVRLLCEGSGDYLRRLSPADRAMAESALAEAKAWLSAHQHYQQRIFQDLEAAVREQRGWDVRSSLPLATSLTRHGANAAEQRILAAARFYLRQRDHADHSGTSGFVVSGRRSGVPPVAPRSNRSASSKKASRQKDAAAQARKLIKRLRREGRLLPADELARLVATLLRASDSAGAALTDKERATVGLWIRKARRPQRPVRSTAAPQSPAPSTPQPDAPKPAGRPDRPALDPLAAAVRTILQRAATTGSTLTWDQIRLQLPEGLPRLRKSQQTGILIRVDRTVGRGAPLLSALVTGADHDMHPAYPRIATAAGKAQPKDNLEALAQWAVELSRFRRELTR